MPWSSSSSHSASSYGSQEKWNRFLQQGSSCSSCPPLFAFSSRGNGQTYTRDEIFLKFEENLVQVDIIDLCRDPIKDNSFDLLHDFLVIEIWIWITEQNRRVRDIRYILAEKLYENCQGKISVQALKDPPPEGVEKGHTFDLVGCGKIQMSRLLKILEDHSSEYNGLKDNCWKYADETIRKVVQELAELPDTRAENKDKLLEQLAKMPPLKLPADAFKVFKSEKAKAFLRFLCHAVLKFIIPFRGIISGTLLAIAVLNIWLVLMSPGGVLEGLCDPKMWTFFITEWCVIMIHGGNWEITLANLPIGSYLVGFGGWLLSSVWSIFESAFQAGRGPGTQKSLENISGPSASPSLQRGQKSKNGNNFKRCRKGMMASLRQELGKLPGLVSSKQLQKVHVL